MTTSPLNYPPCEKETDFLNEHLFRTAFCSILFLSPKTMKNYKWLLLNYQSSIMIMDFLWMVFLTPYFYLPVMGGCSVDVESAILALFEYRHHNVLPAKNAFRFSTKHRVVFLISHYIISSSALIILVVIAPSDQYAAKIKGIELLQCVPKKIFTSCAFVLDSTAKLEIFLAFQAVSLPGLNFISTICVDRLVFLWFSYVCPLAQALSSVELAALLKVF
ncbi:unnamed protein product [Caenorhabditis auriculariae]|uniref:Uncharacterized protein n=1 Tax=Caenorhabditis auriculariae TaxID=2777116 RepID=A0A8S1GQT6_9PELO|nr:unnamed protein product [Caenorhabditis auriculariae]